MRRRGGDIDVHLLVESVARMAEGPAGAIERLVLAAWAAEKQFECAAEPFRGSKAREEVDGRGHCADLRVCARAVGCAARRDVRAATNARITAMLSGDQRRRFAIIWTGSAMCRRAA
jgi:hypothetical protein